MGELSLLSHDLGVRARGHDQAFVKMQRRRTDPRASFIRQLQELLFGLCIKIWGGRVGRNNCAIRILRDRWLDFYLPWRRARSKNQRRRNNQWPEHPCAYSPEPWEGSHPDANPLLHSHFSL